MKTPPRNDAAPAATGAGVNGPNDSPDSTFARLPLVPPVRHDAPETSRIAANRIAGHSANQRARVFAFIVARGMLGATDPEIVAGCGIPIQSVNPRRGELAKLGLIVLNGKRRPSPSNRPARVWIAATLATVAPGASPGSDGPEGVKP